MADLTANDRMLLECIRGEFNNQPRDERFRTGRFMTYEAVMELLREREHAKAALARIDTRIHILLEAERRQAAAGASELRSDTVCPPDADTPQAKQHDCVGIENTPL